MLKLAPAACSAYLLQRSDEIRVQTMYAEGKGPSVWKYVAAWLLAAFSSSVAGKIVAALVAAAVSPIWRPTAYFLVAYLISVPLSIGIWIGVYRLFASLDYRKVVPWMWALGAVGVMVSIGSVIQTYRSVGEDVHPLPVLLAVVSWPVTVLIFKRHFQTLSERRFSGNEARAEAENLDFAKAASFFPGLIELDRSLAAYGPTTRSDFQRQVLARKDFEGAGGIREEVAQSYLIRTFGTDPEILAFAKTLVEAGRKSQAEELANLVRIVGGAVPASELIARLQPVDGGARETIARGESDERPVRLHRNGGSSESRTVPGAP